MTQLASNISDSSYHCQAKGCFNPSLLKGYTGPKRRLHNLIGKCKVYGKNMFLYEHLEKSLFSQGLLYEFQFLIDSFI